MRSVMSRRLTVLGGALLLAGFATGASAALQVFSGLDNSDLAGGGAHPDADAARAAFTAASPSLIHIETFDQLALGPLPSVPATAYPLTITPSASEGASISNVRGPFDTYPSGGNFIDALTAAGSDFYTVMLDIPTRALGFDITDPSDWASDSRPASNLVLTLFTSAGAQAFSLFEDVPANSMVNGAFGFFGVVSDAQDILGFALTNPASNPDVDAVGLDNLSLAVEPVPLPGAAWLLFSALGGLATLRRR